MVDSVRKPVTTPEKRPACQRQRLRVSGRNTTHQPRRFSETTYKYEQHVDFFLPPSDIGVFIRLCHSTVHLRFYRRFEIRVPVLFE